MYIPKPVINPRINQHYISYAGGEQAYDFTDYGSDDAVNIGIKNDASGRISLSSTNDQPLYSVGFSANDPSLPINDAVGINLGNLNVSNVIINNLGKNSYIVGNASSLYNMIGLSKDNRIVLYGTEAYGQVYTMGFTTLVLNGTVHADSTQPTSIVQDYGGNETWAGAAPLTYMVIGGDKIPPGASIEDSRLIAGNLTGDFTIQDLPFKTTASNPVYPHLDIVLNVYQQPSDKPTYTVSQNSINNFSLFQQTGNLNFTGQNTIIALNNSDIAQTVSNLMLTGNDQVWNGNGVATITTQNDKNIIINSGIGGLVIRNMNNTTHGSLSIGNNGLGTGSINYTQGAEDVTITNQQSNILATLGTGTASIDLIHYTTAQTNGHFNITIGTGNEIFHNFTDSSGINPTSQNHLFLESGQNIANVSYDSLSNSTVFSLNTNNQITFTGVDLSQKNPFG